MQYAIVKLRIGQKSGKKFEKENAVLCYSCLEQFADHFFDKACSQNERFCSLANIGLILVSGENAGAIVSISTSKLIL
jgi:hypothetical protein